MMINVTGSFIDYSSPPPLDLSSISRPDFLQVPLGETDIGFSISTLTNVISGEDSLRIGLGSDCRLPCFNNKLCAALYPSGQINTSLFPSVINGNCRYSSSEGINISTSLESGRLITLWGYEESLLPVYIQGGGLQLVSFEGVDRNISNILSRDQYKAPNNSDLLPLYGEVGDWRNSWPTLTGKSIFFTRFIGIGSDFRLLTPFLKFEDKGWTADIHVTTILPSTSPISTNGSIGGNNTTSFIGTNTTDSIINPPDVLLQTPESAPITFLCDVTGKSFHYEETIDTSSRKRTIITNSCPNHFSVCQSEDCGGNQSTRALVVHQLIEVPLYPGLADGPPADMTCSQELVGVALNGVGLYSMSDGETHQCIVPVGNFSAASLGRSPCAIPGHSDGVFFCGDVVKTRGNYFDKCGGSQDRSGLYKYHVAPSCLLSQLKGNGIGGHSPQVGWALDGFPVYGPIGPKKVVMLPCGSTSAHPHICLDR